MTSLDSQLPTDILYSILGYLDAEEISDLKPEVDVGKWCYFAGDELENIDDAIGNNHPEIVEYHLKNGIDTDYTIKDLVVIDIMVYNCYDMAKVFMKYKKHTYTDLDIGFASQHGCYRLVELFLINGIKCTPYAYEMADGYFDDIKQLFDSYK
jgi:hypothetical protein